jgi:N-acyl-D-aspartate/D-glutamate deacylase
MTDREATNAEVEEMKRLTAQAMSEGARGISSGLIYSPSQYQTLKEVVAIAKVARDFDSIHDKRRFPIKINALNINSLQ